MFKIPMSMPFSIEAQRVKILDILWMAMCFAAELAIPAKNDLAEQRQVNVLELPQNLTYHSGNERSSRNASLSTGKRFKDWSTEYSASNGNEEVYFNTKILGPGKNWAWNDKGILRRDLEKLEKGLIQADSGVYASLIRRCSYAKSLDEGRRVHQHIVKSGYEQNKFLANLLIEMYGKSAAMDDARSVFDEMPYKNVFTWNVMISAYGRNGRAEEALQVFLQMQHEGVRPEQITWNAIISAYAHSKNSKGVLELLQQMTEQGMLPNKVTWLTTLSTCSSKEAAAECKLIHSCIIDSGFEADIFVQTALINMYGKCGNVSDAQRIFNGMPQRNIVSWNTMLTIYAQESYSKEALQVFTQMQREGISPDKVTFLGILNACFDATVLAMGKKFHAHILRSQEEPDVVLLTALITMYGKCGSLDDARKIFDEVQQLDVVIWNAMIAVYSHNCQAKVSLQIFQKMQRASVVPTKLTFVSILYACSMLLAINTGKWFHACIVGNGMQVNATVANSMVSMYAKCGNLKDSRRIFNTTQRQDIFSWNAMISGYAQNGLGDEALQLYKHMQLENLKPDRITYVSVLDACASVGALTDGANVHTSIVDDGLETELEVVNALVNMYAKCGNVEEAQMAFGKMSCRDIISWNGMIAAYAQNGYGKLAVCVYEEMLQEGIVPNKITIISILDACTDLADIQLGRKVHVQIVEYGLEADVVVSNALVNAYAKCGSLEKARTVFENMTSRNIISWNALTAGYACHGEARDVLVFFTRMQLEGIIPDGITYINMLAACSRGGMVSDGEYLFISMHQEHGVVPRIEHYGGLLDLFGRAGWVNEAEDAIGSLPFQPTAVLWTTLLSACKMHGMAEQAKQIAARIFTLDLFTWEGINTPGENLGDVSSMLHDYWEEAKE